MKLALTLVLTADVIGRRGACLPLSICAAIDVEIVDKVK
jgi:hypothetical protein